MWTAKGEIVQWHHNGPLLIVRGATRKDRDAAAKALAEALNNSNARPATEVPTPTKAKR